MSEAVSIPYDMLPASLAGARGTFTPVAYYPPQGQTWDDFEATATALLHLREGVQWWIGDCLNHGQDDHGEAYAQVVELFGNSENHITRCMRTANRFQPERRRPHLSWSHHCVVAGLPDIALQEHYLDEAERDSLSCQALFTRIRRARIPEVEGIPPVPEPSPEWDAEMNDAVGRFWSAFEHWHPPRSQDFVRRMTWGRILIRFEKDGGAAWPEHDRPSKILEAVHADAGEE